MSIATGTSSSIAPNDQAVSLGAKLGAYVALTKPRIIELLLVTTVPAMIVAQRGMPSIGLIVATVIGGTLSAGGANAANMWWDRDIDAVMQRTSQRPIVKGVVSPGSALAFAVGLEVLSFVWLAVLVNLLSAALALSAAAFYVFIYTMILKRNSPSNIVIGGAAGSMPAVIGWAAVTGEVAFAPVIMAAIIFLWTPPHFWALAFKYREDYRRAEVPMLPVVASLDFTARRIVAYSLALVILSLLLVPAAGLGVIYLIAATVSGGIFLVYAIKLMRNQTEQVAMRLFHWSITYVSVIFVAMAVDQLILG